MTRENLIEGRDVLTVSDNIKVMKHHIKKHWTGLSIERYLLLVRASTNATESKTLKATHYCLVNSTAGITFFYCILTVA